MNESIVNTAGTVRYNYDGSIASYVPDETPEAPQPEREITFEDIPLDMTFEQYQQTLSKLENDKQMLIEENLQLQAEQKELEAGYIFIQNSLVEISDTNKDHKQAHKKFLANNSKLQKNYDRIKKIEWNLNLIEAHRQDFENEYRSDNIISLVEQKVDQIKKLLDNDMIQQLKTASNDLINIAEAIRSNGFYIQRTKKEPSDKMRTAKYVFQSSTFRNGHPLFAEILGKGVSLSLSDVLELKHFDIILKELNNMQTQVKKFRDMQEYKENN